MNQVELKNTADKIYGYYFPCVTKRGGSQAEFERARKECLIHLRRAVELAELITFEQFKKGNKP